MTPRHTYGLRGPFDVVTLRGTVRPREYLAIGLLLSFVKYAIDLSISKAFHHDWNPLMYVSPRVSPLFTSSDRPYLATLIAVSLPFIWVGVALTVRRVRDTGLSTFWAGVFFAPFIRYAFFLGLAFIPSGTEPEVAPTDGPYREDPRPRVEPPAPRFLAVIVPRRRPAAYALAMFLSAALGLFAYVVTVQVSQYFGAMFFLGMPFGIGLLVAFMTSYHTGIGRHTAVVNGFWVHLVLLLALCAFAFEGVACIVMVIPLVLGISALGGVVGWSLARSARGPLTATLLLLFLPGLVGLDLASVHEEVPMSVTSSVLVRAPVETVWKNVVSFTPIDEPPSPIFALVAMPVEARIEGTGPGALRRCIFTNGIFEAFEEPIEVWNAPHELTFKVRSQPKSIDSYIDVTKGQFRLHDNGDGTTTLEGETFYSMKLRPVAYFGAWGRLLLHAIHMRVLTHVAALSEDPHHAERAPCLLPSWMTSSHGTCRCTRASERE